MQIIEEYNERLKDLERRTIFEFNVVFDAAFNRLVRRARAHIRLGQALAVERHLLLLEQFRSLIPAFRPDRVSRYEDLMRTLIADAGLMGLNLARLTSRHISGPRVDVTIPLDASISALMLTRERLERHGEDFAVRASAKVAQGIAEGRPTASMVNDLMDILDIVKSRAATIVRTESLRAYNAAADRYYSANGIDHVVWYATADDRTCPFCTPRAGTIYNRGEVSAPLHPNCVLGDTQVTTGTLIASTRALYCGNVITVRTANGSFLRVTENHPVATTRGWVRAKHLVKGDKMISNSHRVPVKAFYSYLPDFNNSPVSAEQVFQSFRSTTGVTTTTVKPSPMDFHGEGSLYTGNIEIVWSDRELTFDVHASSTQQLDDFSLILADTVPSNIVRHSSLDLLLLTVNSASSGVVSVFDELLPLFQRGLSHSQVHSLRPSSWSDPHILEPVYDRPSLASEMLSQLIHAGSGLVTATEVIQVDHEALAHPVPVYDFTTKSSSYIAGGVVTHNCRCYLAPWSQDLSRLDRTYRSLPQQHQKEVAQSAVAPPPSILNKAPVFQSSSR